MFNGDQVVTIPGGLPEDRFYDVLEDALGSLGSVEANNRGDLTIVPRPGLKSFFTDVRMDGWVRRKKSGDYEVTVNYSCSPTTATWVLAVLLFLCTVVGGALILVPLLEKGKVDQAVKVSIRDLEDAASGPNELPAR